MIKSKGFRVQCLSGNKFEAVFHELPVFGEGGTFQYLVATIFKVVEQGCLI